ncbi:MAG: type I 3-dehydroquinate dehydratase [Firmicutes bacterium]|nr:type I 3-dehydroquinate dehydratase [Bacillota bacterium]
MKKSVVLTVKGRVLGGKIPNICVPLVSSSLPGLLAEAKAAAQLQPDFLEWRVDYFEAVEDVKQVLAAFAALREIITDYPLIITCRDYAEGGFRPLDSNVRFDILRSLVLEAKPDFIDLEYRIGFKQLQPLILAARQNGIHVILSTHNFKMTPTIDEMVTTLTKMQAAGCDLVKMAVMPNSKEDVLNLLAATLRFTEKYAHIPCITMAMSELGTISRIVGFYFGSAMTFAAGLKPSAPGQLPFPLLKTLLQNEFFVL